MWKGSGCARLNICGCRLATCYHPCFFTLYSMICKITNFCLFTFLIENSCILLQNKNDQHVPQAEISVKLIG